MVATRRLADHLYERRIEDVQILLVSTYALATPFAASVSVLLFGVLVGLASDLAVAAIVTTTLVAGIWCALVFCSAVRDYVGITAGFVAGLVVSLAGTVIVGRNDGSGIAMIFAFAAGLTVIQFWLLSRIFVAFPASRPRLLRTAIHDYLIAIKENAVLGIGGLAAAAAVWIDKWIVWTSDLGSTIAGSLVHAPIYDTPTFVAYLTVIPSLAFFVVALETTFFEGIRRFMRSIHQHATLTEIRSGQKVIERSTFRSISRMMLLQTTLCCLTILLAPSIVELLDMQFRQISVLRFAALATVFHLLFLVCSSLLLFFSRHWLFTTLQILFLLLQAVLTHATVVTDERFLGLGYLGASVISAIVAFIALAQTMQNLGYVIFDGAAAGARLRGSSAGYGAKPKQSL
jgi:uncharacterized membrane protein